MQDEELDDDIYDMSQELKEALLRNMLEEEEEDEYE